MKKFSKRERVQYVLDGKIPDRPPITAYRHFPNVEREPKELAETMVEWQKKYDWDIVKIHPSAVFMQEVYGDQFDYHDYDGLFPKKISRATTTDDLSLFVEKDANNNVLKDHIEAARLIKQNLDEDVPILHTLFTPLTVITNVFECPFVRRHFDADRKDNKIFKIIHDREDELLEALNNITKTYINYWKSLKETGIDGLFYAGISWARDEYMTYSEWEKYVKQFDIKFLNEVKKDGGIIMYHTCGIKSNPQRFIDYPIDILHWDQGAEKNPSIKESLDFLNGITPMGGVDEMLFGNNAEEKIKNAADEEIINNKNIPYILAPYCSIDINSSDEEVRAFRNSVNEINLEVE